MDAAEQAGGAPRSSPNPGRAHEAHQSDLQTLIRSTRPYLWLVFLVTALAGGIVAFVTFRLPRIYEGVVLVEFDPSPTRPLGESVEDVAESPSEYQMTREFMDTQNRIIASRLVAERVVGALHLHTTPSFFDSGVAPTGDTAVSQTAELLLSRMTVDLIAGTRLVRIRVRDRNPGRAALIANTIADTYIEKTVQDRLGSTDTALDWLDEQLDSLRENLSSSELALHAFKEEHNVLSVSMEDRQNLVAAELTTLSDRLSAARTHRIELRARLGRLRSLRESANESSVSTTFDDFPTVQAIHTTLRTALAERETLSTRYGAQHPRLQEVERQIAQSREQLQHELDGIIRGAEADLREASEVEGGLRHAVEMANTAGLELNLREIEYSRLTRERENHAKLYQMVLERRTETGLTRMLRTTHVRVLDRALPPTSPVSPRVATNVGIGISIGLLFGLAMAFALAQMDRRVKSVADVERIGLPVLGVVPSLAAMTAEANRPRRRRTQRAGEIAATSPVDMIVHAQPLSATAENCRSIRTNLMFMGGDRPLKTLLVTSGSPREGKTTVVSNLAISIAQTGKRVCVVDTDMRRPRLHHALGVSGRSGISSILIGDAKLLDVVQDSTVPNLSVLVCGPIPPNAAELVLRDRFRSLLDEITREFDFVVLDSPPLGPVADAAVLGRMVDGVLVVIRAQQTTRDSIASVLRQLNDVGAPIVGAVLNGIDEKSGRDGYYYRRDGYYTADADAERISPAAGE